MALGTFRTADIFNTYPGTFAGFQFFVQSCEFLIVPVFGKLNFGLAVAVDAPSHAQHLYLCDPVHCFDIAMARFTGYLTGINMLCVVEIGVVRQVVYLDPFDRLACFYGFVDLFNLRRTCVTALPYNVVAIHAYVY